MQSSWNWKNISSLALGNIKQINSYGSAHFLVLFGIEKRPVQFNLIAAILSCQKNTP